MKAIVGWWMGLTGGGKVLVTMAAVIGLLALVHSIGNDPKAREAERAAAIDAAGARFVKFLGDESIKMMVGGVAVSHDDDPVATVTVTDAYFACAPVRRLEFVQMIQRVWEREAKNEYARVKVLSDKGEMVAVVERSGYVSMK